MKTHSSITNKQAVLKWERKQRILCIKVRFSSPESMMENIPFPSGWGWDVLLSLEKEFEGAAGAILRWITFELWNSLDCTMGSCGEFSFKYHSMALKFKGFQPISICFFLWPQCRTLHSGPCQVLAVPFVSRYIFQDGGIGISTSFGGRLFRRYEILQLSQIRN